MMKTKTEVDVRMKMKMKTKMKMMMKMEVKMTALVMKKRCWKTLLRKVEHFCLKEKLPDLHVYILVGLLDHRSNLDATLNDPGDEAALLSV